MKAGDAKRGEPVILPSGTIQLTGDLVPAVRELLRLGLSDEFLRSCVRIGTFKPFGGGLKADLVGGLRIDVHAVLKLGSEELERHVALMSHINRIRPKIFPLILHSSRLKDRDDRVFLVMEELRDHVTLLAKVYEETTTGGELTYLLDKVFTALRVIHSVGPDTESALANLPETREPFTKRLITKIDDVLRADPALAEIMDHSGEVMGCACPPIRELLKRTKKLATECAERTAPCLVHGDTHLGNVMVRRSGKKGYRVRLIDPNPEIGFSQPLYDIGKLLHWAEPVGWAQVRPEVCRATWRAGKKKGPWRLSAWCEGAPAAAERRRTCAEKLIQKFSCAYRGGYGSDFEPMLALATASAHVGLAALLKRSQDRAARRFVFAHTLRHLTMAFGEHQRASSTVHDPQGGLP